MTNTEAGTRFIILAMIFAVILVRNATKDRGFGYDAVIGISSAFALGFTVYAAVLSLN